MGNRHRSRSHHSHHRSKSPSKYRDSKHHHHKHRKNSEERELRKKQERLAKARLLLLQEEDEEVPEVLNTIEKQPEPSNYLFKDDLEPDFEEIVVRQSNPDEFDSLDLYMIEIENQAIPQEKIQHSESEQEVQENLDDDDYYQKFIEKFYKVEEPPKESQNKPEVLYDDEADIAWDMLVEDDDTDDYLKKVIFRQQRLLQEKRLLPMQAQNLEPFKKNFYIPCPELEKLTYEEILKVREELGDIQVRGKRCPAPIMNWYQCGLSDKILKILEKKKFAGPFPIQAQVRYK